MYDKSDVMWMMHGQNKNKNKKWVTKLLTSNPVTLFEADKLEQ
jgi:hypothetical protein